ncbi:uncharacterized protein LOC121982626 [Zingiber officinale]|uniref:Uncharacterized protein n=1 Tax=Zingiber officinale TaxID=94328 RepID=A0A8J5GMD5_ZINOF|nr:uncharacterized protein LOC121982626 [Zingiber officinale]KAG6506235.1 hypothetical protein ZIOFF_031557 [Zingiber officinale]
MALANACFSVMNRQPSSLEAGTSVLRSVSTFLESTGIGRRSTIALLASTAIIPEVTDSRKALLQEYLKRSKENKEKYDKERLDDFYKRNYKEYFEFIEGSVRDKKEEALSEAEKDILKWLKKNKK